jgi:hypothetical protein
MGNFYANITVKTDAVDPLIELLQANQSDAYVLPVANFIAVFDRACDEEIFPLEPLTALLSQRFTTTAFGVLNHDDDILAYMLYRDGKKLDDYESRPGFFTGTELPPAGGDAKILSSAFEQPTAGPALHAILHPPELPLLALEQHRQIVAALGLPKELIGFGFRYIGQEGRGGSFANLRKVGRAT